MPKDYRLPSRPVRAVLIAGGILAVGAVVVVVALMPTRTSTSRSVAVPTLRPPAVEVARSTVAYFRADGAVLGRRDEAAAAVLSLAGRPDQALCGAATERMTAAGAPTDVLAAIVGIPDDALRTLLLGEQAAEAAALRACARADGSAQRDAVTEARQLHEAALARRAALAAAGGTP